MHKYLDIPPVAGFYLFEERHTYLTQVVQFVVEPRCRYFRHSYPFHPKNGVFYGPFPKLDGIGLN